MNSATKLEGISQTHLDEEYASKKKKIKPHPDEEMSNSKKLKTGGKSVSKSKISTQKKSEVTFSDKVEEIRDMNKENSGSHLTPFKKSASKLESLKSVKEHQKTPYSKIKEPADDISQVESGSKTNQPNFNNDIINSSSSDSKNLSGNKRDVTPTKKSARKYAGMSRTKSPLLDRIREEVKEENLEKESQEKVVTKPVEHEVSEFVKTTNEEVLDINNVEAQIETVEGQKEEEIQEKGILEAAGLTVEIIEEEVIVNSAPKEEELAPSEINN